jgi:hypothetical protein
MPNDNTEHQHLFMGHIASLASDEQLDHISSRLIYNYNYSYSKQLYLQQATTATASNLNFILIYSYCINIQPRPFQAQQTATATASKTQRLYSPFIVQLMKLIHGDTQSRLAADHRYDLEHGGRAEKNLLFTAMR